MYLPSVTSDYGQNVDHPANSIRIFLNFFAFHHKLKILTKKKPVSRPSKVTLLLTPYNQNVIQNQLKRKMRPRIEQRIECCPNGLKINQIA